ncbi:hypothetical protein G7058_09520 [Jeotgalibaca porci]|uniref:DUF2238 domain-containing protein n=2 Tax=Jeotgalibaca porci TaxID=1868793 RepID=A0A6G7WJB0_9LACT|nr:hypothetical protein [Jeotgalibaca porci]QIK52258.1 hypothetical protein G7058_09520 [Jeotgalibaca porci]
MKNEGRLTKGKNLLLGIVFILLVASIIFAVYMFFQAPEEATGIEGERMKSDYILMILQCTFGALVIFLPQRVENHFEIDIPNVIEIIYIIFLFLAIYLGEVRNFYFLFPNWDAVLHFFSAGMLGAVGFMLVNFMTGIEKLNLRLSPGFVSFFAFCFALTSGVVWEIYEFMADGILGTNMQKFITFEGEMLIGREAVRDTMEDLIVDALGSLLIVLIGYFYLRRKRVVELEKNPELELSE